MYTEWRVPTAFVDSADTFVGDVLQKTEARNITVAVYPMGPKAKTGLS